MKRLVIVGFAFVIFSVFFANGAWSEDNLGNNVVMALGNDISIEKIIPSSFSSGEAQFAISVKNNGNSTKNNVYALVTGDGFSTSEVIAIDSLDAGGRGYVLIRGNFGRIGNVTLTARVGEEISYLNVYVAGEDLQKKIEEQQKAEQEKRDSLANLSSKLSKLKQDYDLLDADTSVKKENNFDVSKVNLDESKKYIRAAESSIIGEDLINAKVNLRLAEEELTYQRTRLNNAPEISTISKLKDYAIIFSALAGAIITFFALSEMIKRKGVYVATTVHDVAVKTVKKNGK